MEILLSCRGCLAAIPHHQIYSFSWPQIRSLFEECTSIKVKIGNNNYCALPLSCHLISDPSQIGADEHGLPQQICIACHYHCEQWYLFRNQCYRVNRRLQSTVPIPPAPEQDTPMTEEVFIIEKVSRDDHILGNDDKLLCHGDPIISALNDSAPMIDNDSNHRKDYQEILFNKRTQSEKDHYSNPNADNEEGMQVINPGEILPEPSLNDKGNNNQNSPPTTINEDPQERIHKECAGASERRTRMQVIIKCPVCKKEMGKRLLYRHFVKHTKERPFMCKICNKDFRWKTLATQHIRYHHPGQPTNDTGVVVKKGSIFESKRPWEAMGYYLDQEKSITEGEITRDRAECPVCKKNMMKQHLYRHFVKHTKERPFICKICEKDFRIKAHAFRHVLKTHPGQPSGETGVLVKKGSVFEDTRPWEAMGYFLHKNKSERENSFQPNPGRKNVVMEGINCGEGSLESTPDKLKDIIPTTPGSEQIQQNSNLSYDSEEESSDRSVVSATDPLLIGSPK